VHIPPHVRTTAQFVLFLGYMPIISSSLRVLDCTPPLDGVRYLRSDLRVPCGAGEHAVGAGVAYAVIGGLGVGFPAALGWMLSTASPEALAQPSFQGAWGFLIGGYRTSDGEAQRVAEVAAALVESRARAGAAAGGDGASPRRSKPRASLVAAAARSLASLASGRSARALTSAAPLPEDAGPRLRWHDAVLERFCTWRPQRLLWWESVVMVRKAGIVLLAVLVTNPFFQCAGAALLLGGALIANLLQQPYAERLFNLLETASLAAGSATAVVAATLLQYDVTAPEFASQPPDAMTATQWAVTVVLGAVNLGTLALLVSAWVYLTVSATEGGGWGGWGGGEGPDDTCPPHPPPPRPQAREARKSVKATLKLTRASPSARASAADGGGRDVGAAERKHGEAAFAGTVNPLAARLGRPGAQGGSGRLRSRLRDGGMWGDAEVGAAGEGGAAHGRSTVGRVLGLRGGQAALGMGGGPARAAMEPVGVRGRGE
jgi:hypothetical protein